MGRRATIQVTMTKGELDPDLSERLDLEHYWDSLASAPNSVFHPQGGCSDRGGFALPSDQAVVASGVQRRLRRRLMPLRIASGQITAANGGNPLYLVDQDASTLFVTNTVTATPFVLCEVDLGFAQTVDFFDVYGFFCETSFADDAIVVQYWDADGAAWVTFADATDEQPAKHIRTSSRTRRFGTYPGGPGGAPVSSRYWRLVCIAGAGVVGTLSVAGIELWRETEQLSPIDVRELARDAATTYEIVFTERNADVFEAGLYRASIPLPVAREQVGELWAAGGFDTMLLFHDMLKTSRITRQGGSGEWNVDALPYEDVPDLKPQIVYSGAQDEIQRIEITGLQAGDTCVLSFGDNWSSRFTFASWAAFASIVSTVMLTSLPLYADGVEVAADGSGGDGTLTIRFINDNGLRAWPLLSLMCDSADADATTTVIQSGLPSSGSLFSAQTGWPAAGAFVQARLAVGGFRAAPTSWMLSRPDTYNFLDTSVPMTADLAMLLTLNTDGVERITGMFLGRHLQIFTESAEWYVAASTYDATQPVGVVRATSHGIRRACPVVFADGGTLFVQSSGQTLRDMIWDDAQQSYSAEPLTVLSPQILSSVVDVAHRSARSVTDGNLILLINEDGTAGCLTLLRGQNVIAGSPWAAAGGGKFKAAMCDVQHRLWAVAELSGDHWLMQWTPQMPLDFATTLTGSGLTGIEAADYLEGRDDVWAIVDGDPYGPFTISGGVADLGTSGDEVTFGLLPEWLARPQVLRGRLTQEQPFRPPGRIYEVELSLRDTGQLTLSTNGGEHREVPLVRMGDAHSVAGPLSGVDDGAPALTLFDRAYTGNIRVGGLIGVSRAPYVELGRSVPAPVHIKSIRMEIVQKAEGE